MRTPILIAVVAFASCAPPPAEPVASTEQTLKGGMPDATSLYNVVFSVRGDLDNGMFVHCTGTLITDRVVLTAAHCLDPSAYGAGSITVYAGNVSPVPANDAGTWIPASDHATHPMWSASNGQQYDVGLVLLSAAPSGVTPMPFNRSDETGMSGAPITLVGFGVTSEGGTDYGLRRYADLTVYSVNSEHLTVGDMQSTGICSGDSGGPSIHAFGDGIKRVVGIHSDDNGNCVNGFDTRVDIYASFIEGWITSKTGASCFEDGLCKQGCTPADFDCVCLADGMCNAQCPNLLSDPDCPANCVANGVCSTVDCPALDPDCKAELTACTDDTQCEHRDCATDAMNNAKYCTKKCPVATDCTGGTSCVNGDCLMGQGPVANPGEECTFGTTKCLQNTNCTSLGGVNDRCAFPCAIDSDCDMGLVCKDGSNNFKLCVPPPPPPDMTVDAGNGTGVKGTCGNCSSFGGLMAFALVLLARAIFPSSRR